MLPIGGQLMFIRILPFMSDMYICLFWIARGH